MSDPYRDPPARCGMLRGGDPDSACILAAGHTGLHRSGTPTLRAPIPPGHVASLDDPNFCRSDCPACFAMVQHVAEEIDDNMDLFYAGSLAGAGQTGDGAPAARSKIRALEERIERIEKKLGLRSPS